MSMHGFVQAGDVDRVNIPRSLWLFSPLTFLRLFTEPYTDLPRGEGHGWGKTFSLKGEGGIASTASPLYTCIRVNVIDVRQGWKKCYRFLLALFYFICKRENILHFINNLDYKKIRKETVWSTSSWPIFIPLCLYIYTSIVRGHIRHGMILVRETSLFLRKLKKSEMSKTTCEMYLKCEKQWIFLIMKTF